VQRQGERTGWQARLCWQAQHSCDGLAGTAQQTVEAMMNGLQNMLKRRGSPHTDACSEKRPRIGKTEKAGILHRMLDRLIPQQGGCYIIAGREWTRPTVQLLASMSHSQLDSDIRTAEIETKRRLALSKD